MRVHVPRGSPLVVAFCAVVRPWCDLARLLEPSGLRVDFHQFRRLGEPLRLAQELAISLLAALAWYTAGRHGLGMALGALSIFYHSVVYTSGERLLKPRAQPTQTKPAGCHEAAEG